MKGMTMRLRAGLGLGLAACCCTALTACTAAAAKGPNTTVTTPSLGRPPVLHWANACAAHIGDLVEGVKAWAHDGNLTEATLTVLVIDPAAESRRGCPDASRQRSWRSDTRPASRIDASAAASHAVASSTIHWRWPSISKRQVVSAAMYASRSRESTRLTGGRTSRQI